MKEAMHPMFTIAIQLHRFRNWRLVSAEDDEGRKCNCILIPLLQNGIRVNEKKEISIMATVFKTDPSRLRPNDRRIGSIVPTIPNAYYEEMIAKGLQYSLEPGGYRAPVIGFVYPSFVFKKNSEKK